MKPIIVYKDQDDNVKITSEEFQRLMDDAYNRGYVDGINVNTAVPLIKPWWTQPWSTDHITITCEVPEVHYRCEMA